MLLAAEAPAFLEVRTSREFQQLCNSQLRFVFPATALYLSWYATYVLLGTFARGLMAVRLPGNIKVGLVIGLGQFVTTASNLPTIMDSLYWQRFNARGALCSRYGWLILKISLPLVVALSLRTARRGGGA